MDSHTLNHLNAWLESAEREDIREAVRVLMLAEYESDPEYWQAQDWPKLRDVAVSPEKYRQIRAEAEMQANVDDMKA